MMADANNMEGEFRKHVTTLDREGSTFNPNSHGRGVRNVTEVPRSREKPPELLRRAVIQIVRDLAGACLLSGPGVRTM
jgi:hypothetical protein